jgi:hypothetical protein
MPRLIFGPALVALAGILSCRMAPSSGPIPVQGETLEVRRLSGDWVGRYWSKDTGRHGTIRFNLPEQADTGHGEVEITFSPALRMLQDNEVNKAEPKPCTILDITVVQVEGERVRGTIAPYWDPDCDCRARTVFDGKLSGDRVSGTFSIQRASTDRRLLTGEWEAVRKEVPNDVSIGTRQVR